MSHPNPQDVYDDECDYCGKPILDDQPSVSGPDGPLHVEFCADAWCMSMSNAQFQDEWHDEGYKPWMR